MNDVKGISTYSTIEYNLVLPHVAISRDTGAVVSGWDSFSTAVGCQYFWFADLHTDGVWRSEDDDREICAAHVNDPR